MITLDYFIDSFIVALATTVILESIPYEIFAEWLLWNADWEIRKYAYCALCVGFWVGLVYFGLAQYFGNQVPFWKGTFLVSGLAYTIKGFWFRLWAQGAKDE